MMELIQLNLSVTIVYVISLLISASILLTWFNSSLPCLLLFILKKCGYKKHDNKFWNIDENLGLSQPRDPLTWTLNDWDLFCETRLSTFNSELLRCKYCLCYHLSFWINLIFTIGLIIYFGDIYLLLYLPLAWLSQPILIHLLNNKIVPYKD